ncbi:MAG: hypothetical protein OJF51_002061 [Nitrospira sp.]|nr:MAG: hypothetical protein OJF51_002061 [Nitrospira sp.]
MHQGHHDKDGNIVGMEIINALKRYRIRNLSNMRLPNRLYQTGNMPII